MSDRSSDGFSLVEVVIAMFLLAVLALGVLPLIVGATQLSAQNRGLLAATAFANDQLAKIQEDFPATPGEDTTSCNALRTLETAPPIADPASGFEARLTVGACPAEFPASVPVVVTVSEGGDDITTVMTRVRVGTA